MKLFPHKDSVIGIDLGSTSIKLVHLVRRENETVLVRATIKELIPAEDAVSREKDRLSALQELLRDLPVKESTFVVSFNDPRTAMRVIAAPPMPKKELREAVRLEAKNYFPFSIEDALIEFDILGHTMEKGVRKFELAVAASPEKTIHEILSLLRKAGIKPASLIPVPAALQKLGEAMGVLENRIHCLADIGALETELVILRGTHLLFSRKVPIGGRDFTQAMRGVLVSDRGKTELSWEEAEEIKRGVGFRSEGAPEEVINGKISTTQLASMLRAPLEQLVAEIDRCLDYYREETGGEKIDQLILFGRGAILKGLSQALSQELGLEVKVGDPLERVKLEGQLVSPEQGFTPFAVALGAALSCGRGINLLPLEIKEEVKRTVTRASVESVVASVLLVLGFFYVGMKIQLANYGKRIAVAQLELSSLKFDLDKVAARNFANQVLANEPYWEDVFKELSNILPREAYLTRLEMKDRKLIFKGTITSLEKQAVLNGLIQDLENGIFKNVKLVTAKETSDKTGTEFELTAWVD